MRMDVKNSLSYFIHSAILPLTIFFSFTAIYSLRVQHIELEHCSLWLIGGLVYSDAFAKMLHDDYAQHAYFCIFYSDRRNTDLGSFIVQGEQFFVLYSLGLSHKCTHQRKNDESEEMRKVYLNSHDWDKHSIYKRKQFTYFSFEEFFNSFSTYSLFDEVLS